MLQCYAIPNMRTEVQICRGNLPPFTAMRGPGKTQATLLMEHVLDSVAAACGLDPTLVRERNLAKEPPEGPLEAGTEVGTTLQCGCHGERLTICSRHRTDGRLWFWVVLLVRELLN